MELAEYHKQIERFFKSKVASHEEARDLTQEVFLKVLKNRNGVTIKNLGGWTYQVAKNTLVDYYRKNSRQPLAERLDEDDDASQVLLEGMLDCQQKFIEELKEPSRYILIESDLKGRSQKELAEELGYSYPTLRSKVQRARQKVKSKFMDHCEIEYDATGSVRDCQTKSSCN